MLRQLAVLLAITLSSASALAEVKVTKSHALALFGPPKYEEGFERFEYTSPNAVKGGRLKLAEIGTFDSTNPFSAKGLVIRNYGLLYDSLMSGSADEPATLYANIAQWVEYPDDFTWVTFYLNPAATFSDGKPITAEDVRFTFETLTTKADPAYKLFYKDVKEVSVLNPTTVKFSLSTSNRDLLAGLASLTVLPKHYWLDREFDKTTLDIPVSSGPYIIDELESGRFVVYKRNKNYWARDLNVKRGIFNFDEIQVDYYRDSLVAFEALKAGNFDYWYELVSKNWATGYDIEPVKQGKLKRMSFSDKRARGITGTLFNMRKPMLQDIALRKAITYAFDFEWTNKNIFYSLYHRTNSFFENTEYQAVGKPSPAELALLEPFRAELPADVFGEAFVAPSSDDPGGIRGNLRTAKKILTDAGYTVKDSQLYAPDGKTPIVIEMIERQKTLDRILNPWIANLKRLGITIELRMIDQTQWVNRVQAYDFEITGLVYQGVSVPGNEQLIYWGSESADTPQASNYMGIKSKAVDAMCQAIIDAKNTEERITAARALDRILMHSYYLVPKYHNKNNFLAYWNKFSMPDVRTTYDFRHEFGIHTWWIDAEKEAALSEK